MNTNLRTTIKNFAQGLFLGSIIIAVLAIIFPSDSPSKLKAAEDYLTVNYQSINDTAYNRGDPVSWGDDTEAEVGDFVQFYIEAQNINAALEAEDFTVKTFLPNFDGGDVQSWVRVSTSSLSNTSEDRTFVNIPEDARLVYQANSTEITADLDQDGSKEYDGTGWNDSQGRVDHNGINLGSYKGGEETVQITFYAKVVEKVDPELLIQQYKVNNLTQGTGWENEASVDCGDTLKFYLEVHNTAIPSTAKNLRVRTDFPDVVGGQITSTAFVDADNADQVSKDLRLNLAENVDLNFVANSTRVTWDTNGDGEYEYHQSLWPLDIFSGGWVTNFGQLYGCNPYILTITFEAVAECQEPTVTPTQTPTPTATPTGEPTATPTPEDKEHDLEIEKFVKWEDTDDWYEDIDEDEHLFDPGETVEYKIIVKNNGDGDADDVRVKDEVPDYISWESGDGGWDSDERTIEFDLGVVEAEEEIRLDYEAKVFDEDDLPYTDREQKNVATLYEDDDDVDDDHCQVWINGPEVEGAVEVLPEAGSSGTLAMLLISIGMIISGWGLRRSILLWVEKSNHSRYN